MKTELELITVMEASRRLAACGMTMRRRLARRGVKADAVLVERSSKSPLFVASRLPELAAIMAQPPIKS
jgi:hypothetical protein